MHNIKLGVVTSILFLSFDFTMFTWLNARSTSALDHGKDNISVVRYPQSP